MGNNIFFSALKYVIVDVILNVLYFPVWWYTKGLFKIGFFIVNEIKEYANRLSIPILFKNLFTPMFGQYDIGGRIISFFVRIAQFFVLLAFMIIWVILLIILFLFWALFPIVVVYYILFHLGITEMIDFSKLFA